MGEDADVWGGHAGSMSWIRDGLLHLTEAGGSIADRGACSGLVWSPGATDPAQSCDNEMWASSTGPRQQISMVDSSGTIRPDEIHTQLRCRFFDVRCCILHCEMRPSRRPEAADNIILENGIYRASITGLLL